MFQHVQDGSQGAGRAPHMRIQAKATKKLAECLGSHTSFEAKHKQGGHNQADQPGAACLGFPQRRLRVAISAIHCLEMAMHTAFGKAGAIRQAPDALFAVLANRVENDSTLGPQSHGVGPCSEGWLKSYMKSALQSTRSTATCPALGGCPPLANGPTSSFFFASTEMTGCRARCNTFTQRLIERNWASRSGCAAPSNVLRMPCK